MGMRSILLTDDNAKGFVKAVIRSMSNIRILPDMTGPVDVIQINGGEAEVIHARTRLCTLAMVKESLRAHCKSYSAVSLYTVTIEPDRPGLFIRGYWHR
jgi:hypothetical protein